MVSRCLDVRVHTPDFFGPRKKKRIPFFLIGSVSVVVSVFSFWGARGGMPEMVHGYLAMSVIILKKVSYIYFVCLR